MHSIQFSCKNDFGNAKILDVIFLSILLLSTNDNSKFSQYNKDIHIYVNTHI